MFSFSLQTFTIFFLINVFINVYYNFFDVYHIYGWCLFLSSYQLSEAKRSWLSVLRSATTCRSIAYDIC